MSDLHNFNAGRKSWKMYAKNLTSKDGDDLTISPYEGEDLILEVSGNGNILFKEDGITYNLADLSNNLTNYDDASFGNVDISGNLDISNGVINFFASDQQLLGPDTGIVQKVQDLSNSVGDLSNNLLTSNNDASFNNVDICGNLNINGGLGSIYGTTVNGSNTLVIDFSNVDICGNLNINGGLAIDNSFGSDGQVLTSKGNGAVPVWSNTVRNVVKFKGTTNTASGADGALHDIKFPNGWTASNTSNTFCEEYGTGGSSSATKDGSIKILENGTYIITTKFVLTCPTNAFQVLGRVTKIPAAGGNAVFIGQIVLTSNTNAVGGAYILYNRSAMDVELEDFIVGDRILLKMFAQGGSILAGTETQIMIEKL